MSIAKQLTVVILTHNRWHEVLRTLEYSLADPDRPAICVVDNGSTDGTVPAIAERFPGVTLIRLARNQGAAGRNHGVRAVSTPYVAFCDDDCWWAEGSLARAVRLLDANPGIAAMTARIEVGPENREDPASTEMAQSPLPEIPGLEGARQVTGLMAGACVVRRQAFLLAGGYEPRLFIGNEERLLSLDLMAAGWTLAYVPQLLVHHHPSRLRDAPGRRRLLLRNALWCAWMRRPWASAWYETTTQLAVAARDPPLLAALAGALAGLPWALRRRRVIPRAVESQLLRLEGRGVS